jgi:hypothetical protein
MAWAVIFHEAFDSEFLGLPRDVQTALAAKARLLERIGPMLGARMPIRSRTPSMPI